MTRATSFAICMLALPLGATAQDRAYKIAVEGFELFEGAIGVAEGKRRNQTKGFRVIGEFAPVEAAILEYTRNPIFTRTSAASGRVSHPHCADVDHIWSKCVLAAGDSMRRPAGGKTNRRPDSGTPKHATTPNGDVT